MKRSSSLKLIAFSLQLLVLSSVNANYISATNDTSGVDVPGGDSVNKTPSQYSRYGASYYPVLYPIVKTLLRSKQCECAEEPAIPPVPPSAGEPYGNGNGVTVLILLVGLSVLEIGKLIVKVIALAKSSPPPNSTAVASIASGTATRTIQHER